MTKRHAIVLLAASTPVTACASRPPNPDPGNLQLHALAADPVFAVRPPDAFRVSLHKQAPVWEGGWFAGTGWHGGPLVRLTFKSRQTPTEVYRFYAGSRTWPGTRPGWPPRSRCCWRSPTPAAR